MDEEKVTVENLGDKFRVTITEGKQSRWFDVDFWTAWELVEKLTEGLNIR